MDKPDSTVCRTSTAVSDAVHFPESVSLLQNIHCSECLDPENGFSRVFIIFFVSIQVIMVFNGLLCTWTAFHVHVSSQNVLMVRLDDCHILEKTNDFCNVNI